MTHRAFLGLVLASMAMVGASGCDKLPGFGKSDASKKSSANSSTVSSSNIPVPPADVLAMVNGSGISKSDLDLRVQELKALVANAGQEWKALTNEQLTALLEDIINAEVMAQAAVAAKLDQSLEVQRRFAGARRQLLTQEWAKSMQQKLTVSAQEIEDYYQKNQQNFKEPPRVQIREIAVASEADAKQALAALLQDSADFATLAQRLSVAPSASAGGLLDKWVMRRQDAASVFRTVDEAAAAGITVVDPALENAVFAIDEVNGLSSHAKGSDGNYHVFQLVGRQEGKMRELSQVSDNIKAFLTIQKVQEAILALKNDAAIERHTDRLAEVTQ